MHWRCWCFRPVFSHSFLHSGIIARSLLLNMVYHGFIPVVPNSKSKTSSCRPAAAAHAGLMPRKRCTTWTECDQPVELFNVSTGATCATCATCLWDYGLGSRPSVDFVKFASWRVAESKSWWSGLEHEASTQILFLSLRELSHLDTQAQVGSAGFIHHFVPMFKDSGSAELLYVHHVESRHRTNLCRIEGLFNSSKFALLHQAFKFSNEGWIVVSFPRRKLTCSSCCNQFEEQ